MRAGRRRLGRRVRRRIGAGRRKQTSARRKRLSARSRSRRRHGSSLAANQRGYADGLRSGKEALLQEFLPLDVLIPDLTPEAAMRAGIAALRESGYPILFPPAVFQKIDEAIREQRPYSFIRLGDGELLTLAQEHVLPIAEIRRVGAYLPKAGVSIPDPAARDALLDAVKNASLVGIPMSRMPYFQPLFVRIARAYGLPLGSMRLTTSTMNYSLDDQGYMMKLMEGRNILVIGNAAPQLASVLRKRGVSIAGVISPVHGFRDAERIIRIAASRSFDLALVSAGIAAVPICVRLAALTGKAAIDFGSLANRMAGIAADMELPKALS